MFGSGLCQCAWLIGWSDQAVQKYLRRRSSATSFWSAYYWLACPSSSASFHRRLCHLPRRPQPCSQFRLWIFSCFVARFSWASWRATYWTSRCLHYASQLCRLFVYAAAISSILVWSKSKLRKITIEVCNSAVINLEISHRGPLWKWTRHIQCCEWAPIVNKLIRLERCEFTMTRWEFTGYMRRCHQATHCKLNRNLIRFQSTSTDFLQRAEYPIQVPCFEKFYFDLYVCSDFSETSSCRGKKFNKFKRWLKRLITMIACWISFESLDKWTEHWLQ